MSEKLPSEKPASRFRYREEPIVPKLADSTAQPNKTSLSELDRTVESLADLREEAYIQTYLDLKKRLETNPEPTEEELSFGTFIEELEPQMRDAVLLLWRKGYQTESSGFYGEDGQVIEGEFDLPEVVVRKLKDVGVAVTVQEGYTSISFTPETLNMDDIKQKWAAVVGLFPDKGHFPIHDEMLLPAGVVEFRHMALRGELASKFMHYWLYENGVLASHPRLQAFIKHEDATRL